MTKIILRQSSLRTTVRTIPQKSQGISGLPCSSDLIKRISARVMPLILPFPS
jgi:hypothetical protein